MAGPKPSHAYNLRSQRPALLSDFASDLKSALDAVTPTGERYAKVSVLALHWANDQMGVEGLESELLSIFKDVYNFTTESFVIPTFVSYIALTNKLLSWSNERSGEGTLRIVIYSGHAAGAGTNTNGKWLIAGRLDNNGDLAGPMIDWMRVCGVLDEMEGDLLYILDCCSAATVAMQDGPETLAACGWEQSAASELETSFTQALITTLRDLKGASISVAQIACRLLRTARRSQVGACLVHVLRKGKDSIILESLQPPEVKRLMAAKAGGSERVLISVRTQYNLSEIHLKQWTTWLTTNIPPGILSVDIKVEAAFQGSGLVLLTIPLELWTMLSATDDRYNFIAHVNSNNILPSLTTELPIRQGGPSGQENRPIHGHRESIS